MTCRRGGCAHARVSREGYCPTCQRLYEHARARREAELASTALLLAYANPQWLALFADAQAGACQRMLEHAAAHQLEYGGRTQDAISLLALRDYLADSMDCIRQEHP
jgi:hypothetical protein